MSKNNIWDGFDAVPAEASASNIWDGFDAVEPQKQEATWSDRIKEVGQGVASSIGGVADLANKVVGAPVAHVAGMVAQGAGYLADKAGFNNTAEGLNNVAKGAYELGGQYQNSNVAGDLANAEMLKTENLPDTTSNVLKATASSAVDVLPFAGASKGLKLLDQGINAVQLVTKSGKTVATPWLNKLNTFLETPLNTKTVASFAGMGAGPELAHRHSA